MDYAASFAQALKQRRKALDLTQQELARQVGCAAVTIQRIEQGSLRPSRQIAQRLAAILALPPDEREEFVRLARSGPTPDASGEPQPDIVLDAGPARSLLPAPLTPLIGRVREVAAVYAALADSRVRLLTLRGPGGIGKTRLALQVAADLAAAFADGVVFVDLAPIGDPDLVASTIAQALGLHDLGSQSLLVTLQHYLRDKHLLLVLDNFEQVVRAAPLVAALLEAAPRLKVVITSRVVVSVYGEHAFMVPPLTLPDLNALPPHDQLLEVEAVRLFVERAQAARPEFRLTEANARTVSAICQRLDGLPLAIEQAAARVRLLPPQALLERLSSRLDLLSGGPRTLPARQQTLRATIDWSHALLDPAERRLFQRLAVFVGGCTLQAVEAACGDKGTKRQEDKETEQDLSPCLPVSLSVLDGLAALIDKSLLLQREGADGEPRFTMLEMIREYALEKLVVSAEEASLRQRHATYYLALAEAAGPGLDGPERAMWLGRLEQEHDNLRAALAWSQAAGGIELGLRLVCALWLFWCEHGHLQEGRTWLDSALVPSSVDVPRSLRAAALNSASIVSSALGDYARAQELAEESLALFREVEITAGIAWALTSLGRLAMVQDDNARAYVLAEERLALHQELQDRWGIANSLYDLGQIAHRQGDDTRAAALFDDSLTRFRELDDQAGIACVLCLVGEMLHCQGDNLRAAALLEQSLATFRELENKGEIPWALGRLARVVYAQGDDRRATVLFQECLELSREQGDKPGIAGCLEGLAGIVAMHGQLIRATHLFAAGARLRETISGQLHRRPIDSAEYERILGIMRAHLDETAFAAAWAEGRAKPLEQAIAEALQRW